jgi:FAD/FMN-containing dehydrogenase
MGTSGSREWLARQLDGAVFDGGDAAAAAEVAGFNTAVTHRPAVVVAARTAADVAAAVRHADREGLPVRVQATGHGASVPADDTVFVSTRRMQGVQVDPVARVARVEAGVRWRSVIDAAVPHGLAPLSGSSSGVGVVGYSLGGGMGHLARRHGFAADHVRAVELVTAEGDIRTVTAESDPELFWAVLGGQGRFGIVSALEFDLVPVPRFFGGAMVFGPAAVAEVLHAFPAWASTMPEEVTTSVALLRLPPTEDVPPPMRGVVSLALRFGYTGSPEQGEALLAPMRRVATPLLDSVGPMSFADVDRIHMDPSEPLPAVFRGGLVHSMPTDLVDTLLRLAGPDVEVPLAVVEVRLMGGALGRPAPVPNAVAGRDGAYSLSVVAPAPPPMLAAAHAATNGVIEAVQPWSTGTSLVNFAGHGAETAAIGAWTPDVLARLRRVKAAVDPDDLFGGGLTSPVASTALVAGAR